MAIKIVLNTIEDLKKFHNSLTTLKIQLIQFQAYTVRALGEDLIESKIHEKMRAAGFDEKIINGTYLDNIELIGRKKARLFFRSEYFSDTGFDVALAREEGTERHFIEPLSVGSPFVDKPEALYGGSKWPFFSKGHWVDGILAMYIVFNTVKEMTPFLQDSYNRKKQEWMLKNLEGIAVAS